jgi:hypothetical protein
MLTFGILAQQDRFCLAAGSPPAHPPLRRIDASSCVQESAYSRSQLPDDGATGHDGQLNGCRCWIACALSGDNAGSLGACLPRLLCLSRLRALEMDGPLGPRRSYFLNRRRDPVRKRPGPASLATAPWSWRPRALRLIARRSESGIGEMRAIEHLEETANQESGPGRCGGRLRIGDLGCGVVLKAPSRQAEDLHVRGSAMEAAVGSPGWQARYLYARQARTSSA